MFVYVIKRISILSLLFIAYGALLTHNFVAHVHKENIEYAKDHQDHHHHDDNQSPLSLALADIVHAATSTASFVDHTASSDYKFSQIISFVIPDEVELITPFVPPQNCQLPFREERIISFSISNTPLRAPPTA